MEFLTSMASIHVLVHADLRQLLEGVVDASLKTSELRDDDKLQ